LFTTTTPALVVIARGQSATIDANAVLKQLTAKFGGKGGGKPDLAQGGGLNAGSPELVNAARTMLT
jgi:alanyl-tRNA synthetase